MKLCHSSTQLSGMLASLEEGASIGLVPLRKTIDVHDIVALRTAEKWCDVFFAVCLDGSPNKEVQSLMAQTGTTGLYIGADTAAPPCRVSWSVDGLRAQSFMTALLALLPSAVVVPAADAPLQKAVRDVERSFPRLFTRIDSQTPADFLDPPRQNLRNALSLATEMAEGGERKVASLLSAVRRGLADADPTPHIRALAVFDRETMLAAGELAPANALIYAEIDHGSMVLRDGISPSVHKKP